MSNIPKFFDKFYILGHLFSNSLDVKCELNEKILFLFCLFQNSLILSYLEMKPFATFKWPFATCGEWRMGWTTLF